MTNDGTISARLGGCYTYWTPKPVNAETMRQELRKLGAESFAPNCRTSAEALRMGLKELAASLERKHPSSSKTKRNRFLVQPKFAREEDGFELVQNVQTQRGEDNDTELIMQVSVKDESVAIDKTTPLYWTVINNGTQIVTNDLQEAYGRLRAEACGSSVGRSLVKLVHHLNGTTIKDDGGLYYLPQGASLEWKELAKVFKEHSETRISSPTIVMDEESAEAIRDGITKELKANADELLEELLELDCTPKMIEHRLAKAKQYRAKAQSYEGIIGGTLSDVNKVLARIEKFQAVVQSVQSDNTTFETADETTDCFA